MIVSPRPDAATADPSGARDRRREPRLELGLPVIVRTTHAAAEGRMVDVSLDGMQVELLAPLPSPGREVAVDLCLSDREPRTLRAALVRRTLGPSGRIRVAVRFLPGEPDPGVYRGRPSMLRSPAPRRLGAGSLEDRLAVRQLRALGARLLELSLEEPRGEPPHALVAWVGRLAAELGVEAPASVGTNRELFRGIAAMHRAAALRPAADGGVVAPD